MPDVAFGAVLGALFVVYTVVVYMLGQWIEVERREGD